jgi:hypothetical protein
MAVFLTEKGKKKYKIYKKGSLPESNNILSHQAEACRRQETPPCLWLEGSFTLEAAVILPVMALFDSNVFPGNAGSDGCTKGIG